MAELATALRKCIDQDFNRSVEAMKKRLIQRAPRDTGELQASIGKSVTGARGAVWEAEITTGRGDNVAHFLDAGTKRHKIRVRRAKVLTDGVNFFGTEVDHPGSTKHVGWWSDSSVDDVFDQEMSK